MKTTNDFVLCIHCGKRLNPDNAADFNYKEGCFCEGREENKMYEQTEIKGATEALLGAMQKVITAQKDCLRALAEQNELLKRYCGLDSPEKRSEKLSNDKITDSPEIKKDVTPSN